MLFFSDSTVKKCIHNFIVLEELVEWLSSCTTFYTIGKLWVTTRYLQVLKVTNIVNLRI